MNEAIDSPEIMVVDLWPANSTLGIVSSHAVAEQVSKPSKLAPYSVLKSTSSVSDDDDYEFLVGRHSLLRAEVSSSTLPCRSATNKIEGGGMEIYAKTVQPWVLAAEYPIHAAGHPRQD